MPGLERLWNKDRVLVSYLVPTPPELGELIGLGVYESGNEDWRWMPSAESWALTLECSWSDGDMLPYIGAADRGSAVAMAAFVVSSATAALGVDQWPAAALASRVSFSLADANPGAGDANATLVGSGSGAILLIQTESGNAHTNVPELINTAPLDPLYVGPLVIGAPFESARYLVPVVDAYNEAIMTEVDTWLVCTIAPTGSTRRHGGLVYTEPEINDADETIATGFSRTWPEGAGSSTHVRWRNGDWDIMGSPQWFDLGVRTQHWEFVMRLRSSDK